MASIRFRIPVLAAALALAAGLSGCAEGDSPTEVVDPDSIVDYTDPAALVAAHARSLDQDGGTAGIRCIGMQRGAG